MSASIDETLQSAIDADTTTEEILLAATNHDLDALRKLFEKNDAKVQDADSGFSPLHAAIAACEPDEELKSDVKLNGEGDAVNGHALSEESALATLRLLFENGAIWNELDANDETPGCLALRLGLMDLYSAIVDAGVRAELLFNRLDDYEALPDEDDGNYDDDEFDDAIVGFEPAPERNEPLPRNVNGTQELPEGFEPSPNPSYKIDEEEGAVGAGQSETNTDVAQQSQELRETEPILTNPNVNSEDYLKSELTYSGSTLR